MRISRRFTTEDQSPYAGIEFVERNSEIRNPDGTTVFRQEGIAVPAEWSSVAVDILAQKYFRKSGYPSSALMAGRSWTETAGRCSGASGMPGRSSTEWPAAGPSGGRSTATSMDRPMPGLLRRDLPHAGAPGRGAQLATMV